MALTKIVSGGQTGVDRAALDAALAVGFPCGGWCPWDRAAEDGAISEKYPLEPVPCGGYRRRTLKNVHDSDGTAILFNQSLSGGTKLTRDLCIREKKPFVLISATADLETCHKDVATDRSRVSGSPSPGENMDARTARRNRRIMQRRFR